MFDFEKPSTRNLTETIITLASMSKFIIADLSSPRSLPHELAVLIPRLQSIPVYPIIKRNEKPYGMFDDFYSYKSVQQIKEYSNDTISDILIEIVKNNEEKCLGSNAKCNGEAVR